MLGLAVIQLDSLSKFAAQPTLKPIRMSVALGCRLRVARRKMAIWVAQIYQVVASANRPTSER